MPTTHASHYEIKAWQKEAVSRFLAIENIIFADASIYFSPEESAYIAMKMLLPSSSTILIY